MAYFRRVRPQAGLRREALSADVAVEGPILGALHLRVVVPQVLLEVGQLDEGPATVREVALVRSLAWNRGATNVTAARTKNNTRNQ